MSDDRHMGGWIKTEPDPRNQNYRIASLVDTTAPTPTREWVPGSVTDQGQTPRCVAFGTNDYLACDPIVNATIDPDTLYHDIQLRDGMALPHDGTTVHAAMKELKARGLISTYVWAGSEGETRAWVSTQSPCLLGADWMDTWFRTTKSGYLSWPKTAQIAGGHCVLICGYDAKKSAYKIQNSWGPTFGLRGFAWLRSSYLTRLMAMGAEVASATELLVSP